MVSFASAERVWEKLSGGGVSRHKGTGWTGETGRCIEMGKSERDSDVEYDRNAYCPMRAAPGAGTIVTWILVWHRGVGERAQGTGGRARA
jgi:hypothetical protein